MALGSEGRFEQTLKTDQDNALIFTVPQGMTADQVRAKLLPVAERINAALDLCGFPLCKGEVMASNPKWCLSLDEWKQVFGKWVDQGAPEALMHASIFFDFRALYGAQHLADDLRRMAGAIWRAATSAFCTRWPPTRCAIGRRWGWCAISCWARKIPSISSSTA